MEVKDGATPTIEPRWMCTKLCSYKTLFRSLVYTANKIKHVNVNREKLDSKWGETWTGVSNEQPLNPMVHHFSFHINPDGGSNPSVVAKGLLI